MPIEILMPMLSPTMSEGTLAKWHKKEGDAVACGDPLAEIETDKAVMEMEAEDEGRLARILVPEGAEGVPVNRVLALMLGEGEDESALAGYAEEDRPLRMEKAAPSPAEAARREESWPGTTVTLTVRQALRDAMAEEMRRDPGVFLMGEDVAEYQGAYKVTQGLLDEFGPRRVIDTPVSEMGFAGLGIGAAFAGLRPVIEFMSINFSMQAIDQIMNSAAKTFYMSGGQMPCPIVFRGPNGAAARAAAQHSQCFASWYAHCPGLKVVAPYTAADAKGLLKSAIRDPNPVIFLENEILYGHSFEVPDDPDFRLPIGEAGLLRAGSHVTITAFSRMCEVALAAAEILAGEGIEAEVLNLRTLRPLDTDAITASLARTNRLVTVEEGWPYAGIGAEIAALVMERAFDDLDAPVARVACADTPLPYAANLERLALPGAEKVAAAAKSVCYRD